MSTTTTTHRHRPKTTTGARPFWGCACPDRCNPRSHGGCSYIDTCACGATRTSNWSAGVGERGPWIAPKVTP